MGDTSVTTQGNGGNGRGEEYATNAREGKAMQQRLLILDDEKSVLDVLCQHLYEEGYSCDSTTSPSEALAWLSERPYALLVTDLRMPEMNGIEVVRRVKEKDDDIALIVLTALTEVTNAIQAMRAGADDYVLKPFNLGEISLCVQRALEKRQLRLDIRRYQQELETRAETASESARATSEELEQTKVYLERLLDSTVDAILTINSRDHISYANRGALRMLGMSDESIKEMPLAEFLAGGAEEIKYIRRVLKSDLPLQNYETELLHGRGRLMPVSMSLSQVEGEDGSPGSILAICKDITEQKRLEEELKEMTIRDSLTGLYNQRYFYDRLEAEIERARRQGHPLSLLLVDVDNFKTYNDAHGHLEGDNVLAVAGEVIRDCTREHVDTAYRYGGDEFTVILPEAPERQAHQIAERIRATFEAKRFDLLTLSIGLMSYRKGQALKQFIQYTDSMMYDAKRAGGNRVYVYDPVSKLEETPAP